MPTTLPTVLLHGFTGSTETTWTESGLAVLIEEMGGSPLPLDLLGHGDRPKPHDPEAYADLENDVLERLPDGPVNGIGFSMGAMVLLRLAAEHPQKFSRLVLGGVGRNVVEYDPSRTSSIAAGVAGTADAEDLTAQMFSRYARESGNDPEALAALMKRPSRAITDDDLGNIAAEVLIVIGDQDFAGPGEPLAERLASAEVVTLKGVDHFSLPKRFEFVDEALRFLGLA